MRSDEVEKGNPTLLGRVYLATFLFARPCLIPRPWERSAGRRPSRSDWSRTKNRRGTTQHKSYRTSKTCVFSNPRTATWVRCSGRHVLAPVLTKIHAREASRHVHAGALISVSSGGPAARRAQGHSTGPFFWAWRKICICNDYLRTLIKSTPTPPNSKGTVWESKSCQTVFTRRRRRQLDKAPDFLRPWGGRLYNLVSPEELRSLFNFFFLQKVWG